VRWLALLLVASAASAQEIVTDANVAPGAWPSRLVDGWSNVVTFNYYAAENKVPLPWPGPICQVQCLVPPLCPPSTPTECSDALQLCNSHLDALRLECEGLVPPPPLPVFCPECPACPAPTVCPAPDPVLAQENIDLHVALTAAKDRITALEAGVSGARGNCIGDDNGDGIMSLAEVQRVQRFMNSPGRITTGSVCQSGTAGGSTVYQWAAPTPNIQ